MTFAICQPAVGGYSVNSSAGSTVDSTANNPVSCSVSNNRNTHKLSMWKKLFIGLSLSIVVMGAQADAYEDGLMAYAVGNYTDAGQAFMRAAEAGNNGAEHMLMRLFSENKIYAQDLGEETLKWTRKAAEKGLMQAQFALADIYAEQQGNVKAALAWYHKAAQQAHAEAHYKLAVIYEHGAKGVLANAQESARLYQVAASEMDVFAQKGSADAQYKLARMYRLGQGVKQNLAVALRWWEKSALQGHALAQLSLGRLYAQGDGVQRDSIQAKFWLNMAAAQGEPDAVALLNVLKATESTSIALAM